MREPKAQLFEDLAETDSPHTSNTELTLKLLLSEASIHQEAIPGVQGMCATNLSALLIWMALLQVLQDIPGQEIPVSFVWQNMRDIGRGHWAWGCGQKSLRVGEVNAAD